MNHNNLWDEDFNLTPLGQRFVERYEANINFPKKLIDEMAQILLVEGKHHNLIEEIKEITSDNLSEDSLDDEEKYLENIYNEMKKRGHVATNPNRKTSGTRDYLRSENSSGLEWG